MAFLKSTAIHEHALCLRTPRLLLRPLAMQDYTQWAEIRALSREHLVPWEPQWARDELSRSAFRRRLRHHMREQREDLGYAFGVFAADERLLGGLTLSNVRRGVTQSASFGYWLGVPHRGQGFMTEAVDVAARFAFGGLQLHRVEAAIMPANSASKRILERNAFVEEGFARSYLKINGTWQDHILYARVAGGA